MRKIKLNHVYKHFKGNYYIVLDVAIHSETGESMVVYRALYDKNLLYVRELNMFLSEVDHVKYPNVKQKYRFQEIKLGEK
ncbi:MAG TPA: DUF1653 domain-containing protein [Bacilli bacterium]|jgi:hypothetical protein|nr:DUF1653 domain-containing protein [Bacilli bacterium]HQC84177.1 DUF1653 domain-containing protein [Bacilli bacterium]